MASSAIDLPLSWSDPFVSESRTHPLSCRLHDDYECSFHCTARKLFALDPNGCMNSRCIGDRMLCAICDLSCANNISSQIDREAGRAAYCFPWNITRSCTEVLRPGANVRSGWVPAAQSRGPTSNAHVVVVETIYLNLFNLYLSFLSTYHPALHLACPSNPSCCAPSCSPLPSSPVHPPVPSVLALCHLPRPSH